jgi:hypothetical protein
VTLWQISFHHGATEKIKVYKFYHLAISQNISKFYLQINKELGGFISELVLHRKSLPSGVNNLLPSPLLYPVIN